jgi:hypothetical protein
MHRISRIIRYSVRTITVIIAVLALTGLLQAQNIGWEGETGVFVTSCLHCRLTGQWPGPPLAAYHFLNGGEVLGDFYNVSATVEPFHG